MMIYAVMYESGVPVMFFHGTAAQLNVNTSPTREWRELSEDVKFLEDVPPMASLPVHPDFVQRTE